MSDVLPVRCFSCGKVTGNKWEAYIALLLEGKEPGQALTALGLTRPCCRSLLLAHIPLVSRESQSTIVLR